jgi:hypothetical protein
MYEIKKVYDVDKDYWVIADGDLRWSKTKNKFIDIDLCDTIMETIFSYEEANEIITKISNCDIKLEGKGV